MPNRLQAALFLASTLIFYARAHPHHDQPSEEQSNAPIDVILWLHMIVQASVWGVLFPIGMVLGITRSRWHVPLQVFSSALYTPSMGAPVQEPYAASSRQRIGGIGSLLLHHLSPRSPPIFPRISKVRGWLGNLAIACCQYVRSVLPSANKASAATGLLGYCLSKACQLA